MSSPELENPRDVWAFVLSTVLGQVRRLVPAPEVADRTAEILLSLVAKGRAWPATVAKLEAYLWVVVTHACSHPLVRRPKGVRVHSLERLAELGRVFAAPEVAEGSEAGKGAKTLPEHVPGLALQRLRGRLSPKARPVLDLHFVEGLPIKAVAKRLGLTPSGVRYHRNRILDRARTLRLLEDM